MLSLLFFLGAGKWRAVSLLFFLGAGKWRAVAAARIQDLSTGEGGGTRMVKVSAHLPSGRPFFSAPLLLPEAELRDLFCRTDSTALESFILGEAESRGLVVSPYRDWPRLQNNHWAPNAGLRREGLVSTTSSCATTAPAPVPTYHAFVLSPAYPYRRRLAAFVPSFSASRDGADIMTEEQDEAVAGPGEGAAEVHFTVVASRPPLEATASRRSLPGAVIRISQARLAEFFEQPSDVSFGSSAQVGAMLAGPGPSVRVQIQATFTHPRTRVHQPLAHPSWMFLSGSDFFYTYDRFGDRSMAATRPVQHPEAHDRGERVCAVEAHVRLKPSPGDFTDHDWREVELPAFPELREFALRVAEHAACPSCNGAHAAAVNMFGLADEGFFPQRTPAPPPRTLRGVGVEPQLFHELLARLFPPVASDTVENYRHRFLGENSGQHSVWEKRLDMEGAPALAEFGGARRKWVPQLMGDRNTGAVVGFYVRRTEAEATTAGETDSDRSRAADGAAGGVPDHSPTFSLVLKMRLRGIIPDSEEPMRVRSEDETARRNNDAYTSDGLLSPLDELEPYDPRTPADVDALHVSANMPQGQEVEPDSGSDTESDTDADSGAGADADFLEQEDEWTVGRRSMLLHVEFRKAVASVSMEAEEAAEEEILAPYGYAILHAGVRGRERVFELQRGLFHSFV